MKINQIEIGNFGKFSNYTLDLTEGLQILFGYNEDGKSTLMAFINMMFYSDQGRSRFIDQNPRKKYQPWSGAPMEGALTFEWNGVNYHLSKLFGDTAGKDKTTLTNLDTGLEIPLGKGEEVGTHFFGLDLSGFQRSSYISQIGTIDAGSGTDHISEKLLSNLVHTGDEEVSQQEVFQRLSNAKYDLVSKSKTKGLLVEKQAILEKLYGEKEDIHFLVENQKEKQKEYQSLDELLQKQKQLSSMKKGYHAQREIAQLQELVKEVETNQLLQKQLSTPTYSPENLGEFFQQGTSLSNRHQEISQGVQPFADSIAEKQFIPISDEELETFTTTEKTVDQLSTISNLWEKSLVPLYKEHIKLSKNYQSVVQHTTQLKTQMERLRPVDEEYQTTTQAYTETITELDAKRELLAKNQELWKEQDTAKLERIDSSKERFDLLKRKQNKSISIPFLILTVLSLVAFSAIGLLIHPMAMLGNIITLVCLILTFVLGRKKGKSAVAEAEEQLSTLEEEYRSWNTIVSQEKDTLAKRIVTLEDDKVKYGNKLQGLPNVETELQHLNTTLNRWEPQLPQTEALLEQIQSNLQRQQAQLREHITQPEWIECFNDHYDSEETLEETSQQIQQFLQDAQKELTGQLQAKQVGTPEEYHRQHLSYQGQGEQRSKVDQMKAQLESLEEEFVSLVSSHTTVSDFATAKTTFSELHNIFLTYQNKTKEILLTGTTLGLKDISLTTLYNEISTKEIIAKEYHGENIEEIQNELNRLSQRDIVHEMKELQQQLQTPNRNIEEVVKDITELEEQVSEMTNYYHAVSLALETMEQASEEMRKSFGPLLNEKTSEIFSRLTNHRYDSLTVDKSYQITVKKGLHYREWRYLSNGTIDQAYLSLRLAIAQLISPTDSGLPLLLDDVLIQYDDIRANETLKFLKEYTVEQHTQGILFTCHQRIIDLAKELNIPTDSLLGE